MPTFVGMTTRRGPRVDLNADWFKPSGSRRRNVASLSPEADALRHKVREFRATALIERKPAQRP